MPTNDELKLLQTLPLDIKILKTQQRIHEWIRYYDESGVLVSFSGGKDSTVLLDITRKMYPNVEAVFVNTGLEYPEIQSFVKKFNNVKVLQPRMRFNEIISKYGYPIISKEVAECVSKAKKALSHGKTGYRMKQLRGEVKDVQGRKSFYNHSKWYPLLFADFNISANCCTYLKKQPLHNFMRSEKRVSITAQMADESRLRKQQWLRHGCNAFDKKSPISNPMSFWREQDVLQYITENDLDIADVYGKIVLEDKSFKCTGCSRTGCIFCGFGLHLEKGETRFQKLKRTHPRQYEYCLGGGGYDESDGVWKPNNHGLGMKHVFDEFNKIYGKNFIRY